MLQLYTDVCSGKQHLSILKLLLLPLIYKIHYEYFTPIFD